MNFKRDLQKGKKMEEVVKNILIKDGMYILSNPKEREMDLLIIEKGVEVKYDPESRRTSNFYIEIECNGRQSGIFRPEEIELGYWAHSDGEKVYLLDGKTLKEFISREVECYNKNKSCFSNSVRVIENGGDGGRSKGVLVPISIISKISEKVYTI